MEVTSEWKVASPAAARYLPDEDSIGAILPPTLRLHPFAAPPRDPRQVDTVRRLIEALASELTCARSFKSHHFMADSLGEPGNAIKFLGYAGESLVRANRLAQRIAQLGGWTALDPALVADWVPAHSDNPPTIKTMIATDMACERAAIDNYCRVLLHVDAEDLTTRILLENILIDELEHPQELQNWLDR